MYQSDERLTRPQLLGMICLGICIWAIVLGMIYAIWEWSFIGLIIAGTGGVGAVLLTMWLYVIGDKR